MWSFLNYGVNAALYLNHYASSHNNYYENVFAYVARHVNML